ncbi:hypothetical protein GGP41_007039 [Bipolaris sorokiniana]|uniref:Peptide hydrolase n=1 Tax=Cochliobolus sativus TaxID=45130 RepID=A0A8H6DZZ2_COCSA|nr:hypothetical protein GGP41_007039 [Bipolaris sorokiniana]
MLTDYTAEVADKITLIARGTCDYGIKSAYSGPAGAVGSILYNIDDRGPEDGTLLAPPRPEGPYVPTLNIIKNVSTSIVAALKRGEKISASFDVYSDIRNITSSNLIATTKSGDHNNKLIVGAHSDGVLEGPAINDVASGLVGNAVTFAFWTTQLAGYLPGSTHFIKNLTPADNAKTRAYLNFDLQYFKAAGTSTILKEYDGRSDHVPFVDAGIPVGGTSTGPDVQKTPEQAAIFAGTAVATYANSWEGFPKRTTSVAKRSLIRARDSNEKSYA